MNPVLTIDPEFEAKCPPLTDDELSQLEENILEEGLVLMPLIVWNDTIVDGHNRYRIAQAHPGIGFRTHEKQFNNRYGKNLRKRDSRKTGCLFGHSEEPVYCGGE